MPFPFLQGSRRMMTKFLPSPFPQKDEEEVPSILSRFPSKEEEVPSFPFPSEGG